MRFRLLALVSVLPRLMVAQSAKTEIWPELDVFWRPAEHQRTFLELSSSTEREENKKEGSIGLYQDHLWLPRAYVRAGYRFTFSMRDASYRESRGVTEGTVRWDFGARLRLFNRTRAELRWINGEYSYRVRDRIQLQRGPKTDRRLAPSPYGTFEAYYDSRYTGIARLGGRVGIETRLGGPASMDVYIAHQDNMRTGPANVTALGFTLKLFY